MSLTEFLSMGGHGAFIWGAYGVTALLLVLEVVWVQHRSAAARRQLLQIRHGASTPPTPASGQRSD